MVRNFDPELASSSPENDPNPNYVLTMDNAKKIIAIHQRLRADIPVIIMGETGCGKTELIKFMSELQVLPGLRDSVETIKTLKVHGGITEENLVQKVKEALSKADKNHVAVIDYALRNRQLQLVDPTEVDDANAGDATHAQNMSVAANVANTLHAQKMLKSVNGAKNNCFLTQALEKYIGATEEDTLRNVRKACEVINNHKRATTDYGKLRSCLQHAQMHTLGDDSTDEQIIERFKAKRANKHKTQRDAKDHRELCALLQVTSDTTYEAIVAKFKELQLGAVENKMKANEHIHDFKAFAAPALHTILFLDEVNTTEAIGLVKEIMSDRRMNGVDLPLNSSLKIVAACNPYREHTPDMIRHLELAGLGFHVSENETPDRFGKIPMRHLVYRVLPLPQSLLSLVWDFGTLDSGKDIHNSSNSVEGKYIENMINKFVSNRLVWS